MGSKTKIAWTDATWNPVWGCTPVSPGCEHCYAKALHDRFRGNYSAFDQVRTADISEIEEWPERGSW